MTFLSETELRLKIPFSRDLLSEGNKTDHWAKKMKRNQRRDIWLNAYWPKNQKINLPCTVIITRVAPRKLDFDNWVTTAKHFRDYIADKITPGLNPGQADSNPNITWKYEQEKGDKWQYLLKIEISPTKE